MKNNEEMMNPLDEDKLEDISGGVSNEKLEPCALCSTIEARHFFIKHEMCPNPNCLRNIGEY